MEINIGQRILGLGLDGEKKHVVVDNVNSGSWLSVSSLPDFI
jgi:hypothetical protein